ncbi:hypothetical protein Dimus_024751 [Dionaea muscipula]
MKKRRIQAYHAQIEPQIVEIEAIELGSRCRHSDLAFAHRRMPPSLSSSAFHHQHPSPRLAGVSCSLPTCRLLLADVYLSSKREKRERQASKAEENRELKREGKRIKTVRVEGERNRKIK